MTDRQVRNHDKFMLRLPDGMRDAIAERAKRNGRSMNSEIVQILQDAISPPPVGTISLDQSFEDIRAAINKMFDEAVNKNDSQ